MLDYAVPNPIDAGFLGYRLDIGILRILKICW